jgi:perosamine synthetase
MARHIAYGRQLIDDDDLEAVCQVLRSDWLTTGPEVAAFESEVAAFVGAAHAVAVSNGTAALHAMMNAIGVGPGDEVLVPSMTFAATANAVLYAGATPVFCDVERDTLLIDPADAARRVTPATRAIVAVDYAGQPCDYAALRKLAAERGLPLLVDACHAIGAREGDEPVGRIGLLTAFSFHPVKHITTGEGGMVTTDDAELARKLRRFRNHGIDSDFRQREQRGTWFYEVTELGYNYRLSDIACALGRSQLKKLPVWLDARDRIAARYDAAFRDVDGITPLARRSGAKHAYHLYVVRLDPSRTIGRKAAFEKLRGLGVGVNVHYLPVHLHPLYRQRLGTRPGMCPVAEAAYEEILSLPMHAGLDDESVDYVIEAMRGVLVEGR